ncbi:hypothetical protein QJQ45_028232, partial [Haematococcus lacustris]
CDWERKESSYQSALPHVSMQVAAASVQLGEAIPSQGLDVLNKQQHQVSTGLTLHMFYDRDVSAALNIRRCAVGPGPRPTELCYWDGRPALPKPGRPGQEWVYLRDKALSEVTCAQCESELTPKMEDLAAVHSYRSHTDARPSPEIVPRGVPPAAPSPSSAAATPPVMHRPDPPGLHSAVHTVVDQCAFSNHCGIPLAFMVDFLPSHALGIPAVARPAARCSSCSAFLNPYCKVDLQRGLWQCCLCNLVSKFPSEQPLHSPNPGDYMELCSEVVEFVGPAAPPETSPRPPSHALTPLGRSGSLPHLVLVVDATQPPEALHCLAAGILQALQAGLRHTTLVSVVSCDAVATVLSVQQDAHVVMGHAISGSHAMDEAAVLALTKSGAALWVQLQPPTPGPGPGEDPSFSSGWKQLAAALASIRPLHTQQPVRERPRCLAVGVEAGMRLLAAAISQAAAASEAQDREGPSGSLSTQAASEASSSPWGPCSAASHLLVFTGGPITRGPGLVPLDLLGSLERLGAKEQRQVTAAEDHLLALAEMATGLGVPIDVVAGGGEDINAPLLAQMCRASPGGKLWAHPGYGATFPSALRAALQRRFGAAGRPAYPAVCGPGAAGVLDCRCSNGLKLAQYLGPVEGLPAKVLTDSPHPTPSHPTPPHPTPPHPTPPHPTPPHPTPPHPTPPHPTPPHPTPPHPTPPHPTPPHPTPPHPTSIQVPGSQAQGVAPPQLSPNAVAITGAVCRGQGVAVRLELTRDLKDQAVTFIQVTLRFEDAATQRLVQRVMTRRLPVVTTASQFVSGVNATVAATVSCLGPGGGLVLRGVRQDKLEGRGPNGCCLRCCCSPPGQVLCKRLVMEARRGGAPRRPAALQDARAAAGAALSLVASRCAKEVQVRGGGGLLGALVGGGGRRVRVLPPSLLPLATALHNLQRGPLLLPPPPVAALPAAMPAPSPPHTPSSLSGMGGWEGQLLALILLTDADTATAAAMVLPSLLALVTVQQPLPAQPPPGSMEGMQPAHDNLHMQLHGASTHAATTSAAGHEAASGAPGAGSEPEGQQQPAGQAAAGATATAAAPTSTSLVPLPALDLIAWAFAGQLPVEGGAGSGGPATYKPPLLLDAGQVLVLFPSPPSHLRSKTAPPTNGTPALSLGAAGEAVQGQGEAAGASHDSSSSSSKGPPQLVTTGGQGQGGGQAQLFAPPLPPELLRAALLQAAGRVPHPLLYVACPPSPTPPGPQSQAADSTGASQSVTGRHGSVMVQGPAVSPAARLKELLREVPQHPLAALPGLLPLLQPCYPDTWLQQAAQLAGLAAAMQEQQQQQQQAGAARPGRMLQSLETVGAASLAALLVGGQQGAAEASTALAALHKQAGRVETSLLQCEVADVPLQLLVKDEDGSYIPTAIAVVRWLRPVRSMVTRSRIRGLMCSTSINSIRFYDRDVSAALNIRRIAAGPGRPCELSSWLANPGRPGQEWVCVRDRGLLRKWQRRHQRQRYPAVMQGDACAITLLLPLCSFCDSLRRFPLIPSTTDFVVQSAPCFLLQHVCFCLLDCLPDCIVSDIINIATAAQQCAMVDIIPAEHIGHATAFISHGAEGHRRQQQQQTQQPVVMTGVCAAWKGDFIELVMALRDDFEHRWEAHQAYRQLRRGPSSLQSHSQSGADVCGPPHSSSASDLLGLPRTWDTEPNDLSALGLSHPAPLAPLPGTHAAPGPLQAAASTLPQPEQQQQQQQQQEQQQQPDAENSPGFSVRGLNALRQSPSMAASSAPSIQAASRLEPEARSPSRRQAKRATFTGSHTEDPVKGSSPGQATLTSPSQPSQKPGSRDAPRSQPSTAVRGPSTPSTPTWGASLIAQGNRSQLPGLSAACGKPSASGSPSPVRLPRLASPQTAAAAPTSLAQPGATAALAGNARPASHPPPGATATESTPPSRTPARGGHTSHQQQGPCNTLAPVQTVVSRLMQDAVDAALAQQRGLVNQCSRVGDVGEGSDHSKRAHRVGRNTALQRAGLLPGRSACDHWGQASPATGPQVPSNLRASIYDLAEGSSTLLDLLKPVDSELKHFEEVVDVMRGKQLAKVNRSQHKQIPEERRKLLGYYVWLDVLALAQVGRLSCLSLLPEAACLVPPAYCVVPARLPCSQAAVLEP